jgi:phosphoenolpyruvate carboxykinase (ATP)
MAQDLQRTPGLDACGIETSGDVHWNQSAASLYEAAVRSGEGRLGSDGPLVCLTGAHTGRSPRDKFLVKESSSESRIDWGTANRPLDERSFDQLHRDMAAHLRDKTLYVLDAWAGADSTYRLPIRIVNELAWHNLFARNMFLPENDAQRQAVHVPAFTVLAAPSFKADPARHHTRSEVFICVHFAKQLVLIGGTSYAGEIKKSIFTILNYLLPLRGVLPMHCSVNVGGDGDSAVFFGLSGTGKTTLSSDPERRLLGDDEHGWSDGGLFNFEGGCYAKTIRLSADAEPQIYATTRRFGTVLENVVLDTRTGDIDLEDASLTENTRASYPLRFIDNAILSGQAGHPRHIVMLTADAYGVLPPIARLTPEGAMYHFLSGYTARVAGTEKGVTEPEATFSSCFGAPFLPMPPSVYATLLGQKMTTHQPKVWLVNTGWVGGPHGVGSRIPIGHTRAMLAAALAGRLDDAQYGKHQIFNVDVPLACPGVPASILDPRGTWASAQGYDEQAKKLARMFADNFKKVETGVAESVRLAGPRA